MAIWDPLWKGLGVVEEEEIPAPETFGSSFDDNSIKKRVSFAAVMSDEDEVELRKKKWKWRRRQRKSKKSSRKRIEQQRRLHQEASLDEFSNGDEESFDSFEERAMEHRDEENLDDDLWDGSDSREDEEEGVQGGGNIWTAFFNFGDNFGDHEKDFEDGWTEADSTYFTQATNTTHSSCSSQKIRTNGSTVSSLDSDGEGEGIELVNKSSRSLNAEIVKEAQKEEVPRSCLEPSRLGWYQGGGEVRSSTDSIPVDTVQAESLQNTHQPEAANQGQTDSSATDQGTNASPDKYEVPMTEKRKKKKLRWMVGKHMAEKSRRVSLPPSDALTPISEGTRDEHVVPPRKIKFGVDEGESGIAHKSCMPVLFHHERHHANKEPIGRLLCRSQKSAILTKQSSIASDLTSQATSQASSLPRVRIISDTQGNQGHTFVANKANDNQGSDIRQQMQLEESTFASSQGPQSIYTYDYDSGTHMGLAYNHYGDDPEAVMSIREYNVPLTVLPGTNDVIVMVEVRHSRDKKDIY